MNIKDFFDNYLGWCPGYKSASKFVPDKDIAGDTIAIFAMILMVIIAFSSLNGIIRFMVIAFAAFIGIPACWIKLRGDKAGPQEGTYPEPLKKPLPSEKFGEFNLDSPGAEASVFGPSRSNAGYNLDMYIQREWLHPDILWHRKHLKEEKEKEEK